MNTPQSQEVVGRFFEALQYLIDNGEVRSMLEFAQRYGISHTNFYRAKSYPARQFFQPGWLTLLVINYGVSAEWLITGRGEMLLKKRMLRQ